MARHREDGRMLRSFGAVRGGAAWAGAQSVIPLMKHEPAGRREQSMTVGTERQIPASLDCPWTFSSTYRLIALIRRQLTGQAYCDALSAARTDDDQVNDLTVVRSTQRVLQIEDVARTLAVDSND
jgi:hypothetical protein